jgi:hypothetical protein
MPAHSRSKNGVASASLRAGIHVFSRAFPASKTWMAGSSPAMTGVLMVPPTSVGKVISAMSTLFAFLHHLCAFALV